MALRKYILCTSILFILITGCSQDQIPQLVAYTQIVPGDQRTDTYLPLVNGKKVGVVANNASLVGSTHLIDTLLASGIRVAKIFSPEHGFRGNKDAGEAVGSETDSKTGIQVISLYGSHKKPSHEDLDDVEVMIFDLQDVGVRFYTYISTLTYVMETCAENNLPLIVLDRPNPNAFYMDGPVLEEEFTSFVGMHQVPVVYGMTIGEYALMVNGENWLPENLKCDLTVIRMEDYNRNMIVQLPENPSPNLPNWQSVYLYPSLCFFEGTIMSVGRGTQYPFQVYGHPNFPLGSFSFTPAPSSGAMNPKYNGIECYGQILTSYAENYRNNPPGLHLTWLIESYRLLSPQHDFFIPYFDKLAGTEKLRKQIETRVSEEKIRASWKTGLNKFSKIRQKYLLYE